MDLDGCWALIESVRADVNPSWDDMDWRFGEAMIERLAALPPADIVVFQYFFDGLRFQVHSDRVWQAARLIQDGCGDDSFSRFCAGLISLGPEWYGRIAADADALAEHPAVRGIAAGTVDRYALQMETFEFSAYEAYEQATGIEDGLWTAADDYTPGEPYPWTAPTDSSRRLPRLEALFPESAAFFR
ncbi:DUF4240 domain-containing protein [Catellatospora coxensis]|uniref:DUF4240 domain-containing protein n=1 Tax=Catellatospora coxensis TaxID=310354 RepID=A0A8J3L3G6_9ACTN|nr:DUF4240 domain-containing protein [Catellatospora coxensis]GIG05910.1 hypothetical protein Cco03nite_26100 [Catellatospora coxensis]